MKALVQFCKSQKIEIYDIFGNQSELWISPFQQYDAEIEEQLASIKTQHGIIKINVSEIRVIKVYPEVHHCEWCEKEIEEQEMTGDWFLTGFFGYIYCSEQCMEDHINSK